MAEQLVHNERVKLKASALNGLAIACFITAFIQNVFLNALPTAAKISDIAFFGIVAGFSTVGLILHYTASQLLGDLKEKDTTQGGTNDPV